MKSKNFATCCRAFFALALCALLTCTALTMIPGCGGSDTTAPNLAPSVSTTENGQVDGFELVNIDPEPLAPQQAAAGPDFSGRTAASTWGGCPTPPPPGVTTADSSPAGGNPAYLSDGAYHMLPSGFFSVWQGTNYSVYPPAPPTGPWDIYINYGAPRIVDRVSIAFHSLPYAPTTLQVHYSNDPCGAGWTAAGNMVTYKNANNANDAEFYYAFSPAITAQYIWIDMDGTPPGGFAAIRDIDWEPVAGNQLAYARPNWDVDSYYPSNAFDGDWDTVWTGEKNAGSWNLYYRFPAPEFIPMADVEILSLNYRPTTMNFYTSNDGVTWTFRGEMGPLQYDATQFVNQTAQYVRIEMLGIPPSTFPYIRDVYFHIPWGASSGDSAQAANPPSYAFDGNYSTYWAGKPGQSEWELIYRYANPTYFGTVDLSFHSINHTPGLTTMYCSDDGITWTSLGNLPFSATPSLTVNTSCRMVRFHMENTGGNPAAGFPIVDDAFLVGWRPLGTGAASGTGISGIAAFGALKPDIATFSSGNPVIAWYEKHDPSDETIADVYLKYWDGSQWQALGGSATGGGISADSASIFPKVAVDSSDIVYVVWESRSSGTAQIYIQKFDSGAWVDVGLNSSSGAGISNTPGNSHVPVIAFDGSGRPVVAWYEDHGADQDIYVKYFVGGVWQPLGAGAASGGGISLTNDAWKPAITINSAGRPVIAWADSAYVHHQEDIYVKHWTGSSWQPLGAGAASLGGISDTVLHSDNPAITTDDSGNPIVVWDDDTPGVSNTQIYGKRWSGSAWVEIGPNSASGNWGISGHSGNGGWPAISKDASANPIVAWWVYESATGNFEIHLKRYDSGYWYALDNSHITGGLSRDPGASIKPAVARNASGNPIVAWWNDNGANVGDIFVKHYIP